MVAINLLPWRARERVYQLKLLKIISSIVFGIILCINVIFYLSTEYQIDHINEQVAALRQQIEMHSSKQPRIQHEYLHAQALDLIIKRLLVSLGHSFDQSVCFTSITRAHNRISFVGRTRSATDLTSFLHAWQAANLFSDMQLKRLARDRQPQLFFHFQANVPDNL